MSILFDAERPEARFKYDNYLDDDVLPITLATLELQIAADEQIVALNVGALAPAKADALIDHWSFSREENPPTPGDFDDNGTFDAEDIDRLHAEIQRGTNVFQFDLVADGIVDALDSAIWVHTLSDTYFGDANLDGAFNSSDLVSVFKAGLYEDGSDAGWGEGDWSGDGEFGSADLVVAIRDGGYEQGPRGIAVPEPNVSLLFVFGLLALRRWRRLRANAR